MNYVIVQRIIELNWISFNVNINVNNIKLNNLQFI